MKFAVCAAALILAGCGTTEPPKKAAVEAPKQVEYFHVDTATAGSISGTVVFRGAKPARQAISMEAEAGCAALHKGKPVYDEAVVTGKNGALANAFVYIQSGLEGKKFEPTAETANINQSGCMFAPRVLGVRAGETINLKNSDPVSHNIHPVPQNNREWNEQQSPGTPDVQHRFGRPEVMIPVKCNVHSWMRAWIGVVDHPYFAVTGADGAFSLKNVPPGDYTISVWHEKLGEQKQQVKVANLGAAEANFAYQ
jgi:plastocyanin